MTISSKKISSALVALPVVFALGACKPAERLSNCSEAAGNTLTISGVVQGVALVADFMGCSGVCSMVVLPFTATGAGTAYTVGCPDRSHTALRP